MSDYKFKDASMESSLPVSPLSEKYYPRFNVDLDKFPDLESEIGESVELHMRGTVCGIHKSEGSSTMDIEVKEIGTLNKSGESGEGGQNEADRALENLKTTGRKVIV